MTTTQLDRMIGLYCKIVIKESGDEKAHVVTGTIQDIDHQRNLLMVQSYDGVSCLSLETIVAIKPKRTNDT